MKKTLLLCLSLLFIFTGCGKKTVNPLSDIPGVDAQHPLVIPEAKFVQNPFVEKYKDVKTCEGREDFQDCYANKAVGDNDPTLCAKLEPGLDTLCLQYFYIQRNDPKSCNLLPNKGIKATCNDYYKNGKK